MPEVHKAFWNRLCASSRHCLQLLHVSLGTGTGSLLITTADIESDIDMIDMIDIDMFSFCFISSQGLWEDGADLQTNGECCSLTNFGTPGYNTAWKPRSFLNGILQLFTLRLFVPVQADLHSFEITVAHGFVFLR